MLVLTIIVTFRLENGLQKNKSINSKYLLYIYSGYFGKLNSIQWTKTIFLYGVI